MSATSFLRHRRAVAAKYIRAHLIAHPKEIVEIMKGHGLTIDDLATLEGNNDSITIADRIAELKFDEPELDSLETLNVEDVGERAGVHNADVREDQFEDNLQHPSQETVGVSNMHDGPQAAIDLANVGSQAIIDAGGVVEAAEEAAAAQEDALANHAGLPPGAPTTEPAADEITAENEQETDPDHVNEGAETIVDKDAAAKELAAQEAAKDKLASKSEAELLKLNPSEVREYAASLDIELKAGPRSGTPSLVKELLPIIAQRDEEKAAAAKAAEDAAKEA